MDTLSTKKKIIFSLVACALFIGGAEFITRLVFSNSSAAISIAERKNTFEPYQNKPWTEQYFKDEMDCNVQRAQPKPASDFVRYVMYDVGYPECHTPSINYIEGTKRKTWSSDRDPHAPGITTSTVAFFGGSTTQGAGVPDDLTIPSQFSKLVNSATGSVLYEVENYGVSGYTYTQAVMKLTLLLREGKKFDYVVFYNGANDIDNAYEAGRVGAMYGEKTVESRLYGGLWGQVKESLKDQLGACGLCRLGITLSRHTPFFKDHVTPYFVKLRKLLLFKEAANKSEDDLAPFAQGIVGNYVESHDLLDHLSHAYGFTYFDFWQPTLHYEDGPVEGEALYWSIDNRLTDEKLKLLFRMTHADVLEANMNNFYDLSNALVGRTKAYYLDAVHISDEGNEAIAQKMFDVFRGKR